MRKTVARLLIACITTGLLSGYIPGEKAKAEGDKFVTNNTYIHECDHSAIESILGNIYGEVECLDKDFEKTTKTFFDAIGPGHLADIIEDEYEWFRELDEFRQHLEQQRPNVTEVYSLNRQVDNCPWQPSYEELNDIAGAEDAIAALVGQAGASYLSKQAEHDKKDSEAKDDSSESVRFASVYTGTFNNGGYFSNDAVLGGVKYEKPQGKTCRALEILGYDMLIRSDKFTVTRTYDENSPSIYHLSFQYESEAMPDKITWADAVMSIYKALDQNILKTEYWVYKDEGLNKLNTMAAADLASYVHDINGYYTLVFATRTNRDGYWKRAVKELGLVDAYKEYPISYGEFIILLAELMEYCGEPVMSDIEMHALLQVYGATVPTYLSQRQQQAYLYLKARGVLNEEFDYIEQIDLMKILNILMCVKDKGSRTNFKEIQVTYDIGDELVSMGYFPKEVAIATGDKAVTYDIEYDYVSAQVYDYFVEVCAETTFKDELEQSVSNLFVAKSVLSQPKEGAYEGSQYLGIYTDENNKQWYHFVVPVEYPDGLVLINTPANADRPKHVTLKEKGGGFYKFDSVGTGDKEDITYMKRVPFKDGEMERYVDKERKEAAEAEAKAKESAVKSKKTFWQRVADVLFPTTIAYAAAEYVDGSVWQYPGASTKVKLYNTENLDEAQVRDILRCLQSNAHGNAGTLELDTSNPKYWIVTLPELLVEWFTSRIIRNDANINVKYTAITALSSDNLLVSYKDLVSNGVLVNTATEGVPIPEPGTDDQLLILYTPQGEVRINNATREIVVGNNVYRVRNDNTLLFKYIVRDGVNELLIDFRAVYGWSSDRVNLNITGSGKAATVNVSYNTEAVYYDNIRSAGVKLPYVFRSIGDDLSMDVIPVGVIQDGDTPKLPMTSSYCLANWVMYQKYDTDSGRQLDYLIVFYPKYAFTSMEVVEPNNELALEDIAGYAVSVDDEWTYRIFTLDGNVKKEPGQMTYTEEYGYVYNVPTWTDFTLEKYLTGEYMLPISHDMGHHVYINANVNYYGDVAYGSRPKSDGKCVDIKGTTASSSASNPTCYAAPAGIASFFGVKAYRVFQANSSMLKEQVDKNKASVYFGTSKCDIKTDNEDVKLTVKYNNGGDYTSEFEARDDTYFYRVQTRAYSNRSLVSSFIAFDKALNFTKSELPESVIQAPEIEIIDGETKDTFDDDSNFTFDSILNAIDSGASFIIVFVFVIFPLIGIIAITILAGLVIMGDSKICRKFAEKVFDPVKILTFGTRSLQEYRLRDCMWSLCIGYTIFGLMYDGNVIRAIQWVLTSFGKLAEYIKFI